MKIPIRLGQLFQWFHCTFGKAFLTEKYPQWTERERSYGHATPSSPHCSPGAALCQRQVCGPRPPHLLSHSRTRWRLVCMLSLGPHPRETTMSNDVRKALSRLHRSSTRGCLCRSQQSWGRLGASPPTSRNSDTQTGWAASQVCFASRLRTFLRKAEMMCMHWVTCVIWQVSRDWNCQAPRRAFQHDPLLVSRTCHEMVWCKHQLHE